MKVSLVIFKVWEERVIVEITCIDPVITRKYGFIHLRKIFGMLIRIKYLIAKLKAHGTSLIQEIHSLTIHTKNGSEQ